ncbi:MAG: ATP-binding cassette domain-containing protein [Ruminococcus sp.]|nr:ATP-binding cassette domain-containing protein [Ruminococcus sp.]
MNILEIKDLRKSFGKKEVLHGVGFSMKRGGIYGLVGPNGAGKSTIMKIMGGLIFPTAGEINFYNSEGNKEELQAARRKMSFMIETPYLKSFANARQNLEKQRLQKGLPDKKIIDRVLESVGLSGVDDKKQVRQYSLGMKQRLGIATALMCDPELLVLDEPVNGLDPAGIHYIRELLLKLNQESGVTILISSHILSELSQLCTDYIFIGGGNILETATAEELERSGRGCFEVVTTDNEKAFGVLGGRFGESVVMEDGVIKLYGEIGSEAELSEMLFAAGAVPTRLARAESDLEKYYLEKVPESEGGIE